MECLIQFVLVCDFKKYYYTFGLKTEKCAIEHITRLPEYVSYGFILTGQEPE